jgi:sugar O-acyltransferase (sialic acid O-acetyltransferase NeuD family)
MSSVDVVVPRLNANEDQVLVASVLAKAGTRVAEGDLLFVLETTKASSEVLAPADGEVTAVNAKSGQMVDVGAVLCVVGEGAAGVVSAGSATDGEVKITAKAQLRAKELGIDVGLVPAVEGRVGVAEVEAFAAAHGKDKAPGPRLTTAQAVMIGGGGHAATLADALEGSGWDLVGALDDGLAVGTVVTPGLSVIGGDGLLPDLFARGVRTAFVGVGGATSPAVRRKIYEMLLAHGFHLPPIVHRTAHLGVDVKLGPATYVLPGATIGPRCRIGANVIVNSGSIVCHDSQIEDHVHITPGAILAGTVRVGEGSTIGMAATVLFGSKIGRGTVIHNSAAVAGDVGDNLQYTHTGQRLPNA